MFEHAKINLGKQYLKIIKIYEIKYKHFRKISQAVLKSVEKHIEYATYVYI